ncbi:hypothetical protein N9N67_00815 [Bacteriovoracaceae bacterium]|nr:hypothetical protein [Bacteriovoracaceae bacterium]
MKILTILFIAVVSNSLTAKETLKYKDVEEIRAQLSKLRVYVSSRLVSKYSVIAETSVDTDKGELDKRIKKKELTVKVKKRTKGKIVNNPRGYDYNTLYVSFDSDCQQPSCAYTFKWARNKEKFVLRQVPKQAGLNIASVKKGFPIKIEARKKSRVYLKYDRNELVKVTRKTKVSDGHPIE